MNDDLQLTKARRCLDIVKALLLLGAALITPPHASPAAETGPVRDEALERLFRPADSPWRGADANYSVPLGPDRVLWLFGDSWIVTEGARGREGGRLVRNTMALQRIGANPTGAAAAPGASANRAAVPKPAEASANDIEFFWRKDPANDMPRHAAPAFAADNPENWLWPLSGLRLGPGLALFMSELVKSDEGFGFASRDNWVVVVENPDAPPAEWRTRRARVPFFRTSKTGDRAFGTASALEFRGEPRPYLEAGTEPEEMATAVVYVYGVREDWRKGWGSRAIILARVGADDLLAGKFDAWRFWDGAAWSPDADRAADLFSGAASEMSVSWLPGPRRYVAVYTEFGLSEKILARTASRPEGPWDAPRVVYRVLDAAWSKDYFTYAGKAHPELAASPDELVISYAVNSKNLRDHLSDLRIYWPRFVRVRLRD